MDERSFKQEPEMASARTRPLSPHLSIWKWGPHMAVSIAHRVMGVGLATVGVAGFVWWLTALASGPEAYAVFHNWVVQRTDDKAMLPGLANGFATVVAIGLTFAFFLHMANGIRHLFMDMGANFELRGNKQSALMVFAAAFVFTAVAWAYIFLGKA